MKIGMRNIKTALAVFLCIVLFQVFNMGSPFYAAIAAIISMQSSVMDSFKTGKNRILGTFLGALIGLIFALIGPSNPLLIGLGIIIIISVSNWLKWNKSITIAGVVFIAIMVNLNGKSPWTYSMYRIIDTLVGIGIAVLINYFISPPIKIEGILKHTNTLLVMLLEKLKAKLSSGQKISIEDLNKEIQLLEKEIWDYKKEFKVNKGNSYENSDIKKVVELLKNIFDHLKIIDEIEYTTPLGSENSIRVQELLNISIEPSNEVDEEHTIVYNYHLSKILNYYSLIDSIVKKNNW
jgi:uncharacterized membrane protein YgaE (UPF0421/DUF939 family)